MKTGASRVIRDAALDNRKPLRLDRRMDTGSAGKLIETALDRMRAAYLAPVFDEWAIVSERGILVYAGPRTGSFAKELGSDIAPLREALSGQVLHVGDIDFAAQAEGKRHDAVIKVGATAYLLLNHTRSTLETIRANPRWREAQRFLFALCERFRADPLT